MCEELFKKIDELEDEYLSVLEDVCNIESPTTYKKGVDAVGEYFMNVARRFGWDIELHKEEISGNAICISFNTDSPLPAVSLSGHMDTVFPLGLFPTPAVRREGDRMYGPGTKDCKGGIVAALYAMHALYECKFTRRPVKLILQSDEEMSSAPSQKRTIDFMCRCGAGSVAFLNLENQNADTAVIIRKGILRYKITVRGIAAHSSLCLEGASAICEAAHKIIKLEGMKENGGLTCNCGVISGGTVANTVADQCTFTADIRFATEDQMTKAKAFVEKTVNEITVPGCTASFELVSDRPPMQYEQHNQALLDRINEILTECNLPTLTARSENSGSDAAYTSAYGIPTIDSIGTCGGPIHSPNEYMTLPSLKKSALRIAAIIYNI